MFGWTLFSFALLCAILQSQVGQWASWSKRDAPPKGKSVVFKVSPELWEGQADSNVRRPKAMLLLVALNVGCAAVINLSTVQQAKLEDFSKTSTF